MTRVLVVSAEPVGPTMAGPAIRALELSRALADHCEVTLAAPGPSELPDDRLRLLEAGLVDFELLLGALREHDVVVAQRLPPQLLRYVARMPIRFVADLYNPQMIEVLEAMGEASSASSPRRAAKSMLGQCAVADLVICASEKQRDLWLGGMGMNGLIDLDRYRADPTFRSYVDVVPFGIPDRPPRHTGPVLKGVWPGIAPEDKVMLWGGGVSGAGSTPSRRSRRWSACAPRAATCTWCSWARDAPRSTPPASPPPRPRRSPSRRSAAWTAWACTSTRAGCPTRSARGTCSSPTWACARTTTTSRPASPSAPACSTTSGPGLPSVVSGGDAIGDLVDQLGLGTSVAPDDDEAFAAACAALLDDPAAHDAVRARVRAASERFRWTETARPLVNFCVDLAAHPPRHAPRGVLARATYGQYPDIVADMHERGGLGELAKRMPKHVTRVLRHRS